MSEMATIKLRPNGSLGVTGPLKIIDANGQEHVIDKPVISLCRCGHSKRKPFCDASHKTVGFEDPGLMPAE